MSRPQGSRMPAASSAEAPPLISVAATTRPVTMASTPAMAPMMAASVTTMAWTWPTVMPCDRRMAISRTRSLMPIPSVLTIPSAPMTTAISARTSNSPSSVSSDRDSSPARSRAVSG